MNKTLLKEYMEKYGEIQFFRDLSSIFVDLKEEWKEDNADISNDFGAAEILISSAADILEKSEKQFKGISIDDLAKKPRIEIVPYDVAVKEYIELQEFFANQSFKEFKKYYYENTKEFDQKLIRMKALQDAINSTPSK